MIALIHEFVWRVYAVVRGIPKAPIYLYALYTHDNEVRGRVWVGSEDTVLQDSDPALISIDISFDEKAYII